jgi:hypothetical protein
MSNLREAAEQALAAMHEVNWYGGDVTNAFLEDAIIALRTALSDAEQLRQEDSVNHP